jgi:hypothetical protein
MCPMQVGRRLVPSLPNRSRKHRGRVWLRFVTRCNCCTYMRRPKRRPDPTAAMSQTALTRRVLTPSGGCRCVQDSGCILPLKVHVEGGENVSGEQGADTDVALSAPNPVEQLSEPNVGPFGSAPRSLLPAPPRLRSPLLPMESAPLFAATARPASRARTRLRPRRRPTASSRRSACGRTCRDKCGALSGYTRSDPG